MIASIVGPPEPIAASQPVQSEIVAKAPVREPAIQASAAEAKPAEAKAVEAKPKSAATVVREAAKEASAGSPLDINVRFRVDQKTQAVTVFLLNQQTREVIRTIPPNELAKLKPGDLVNLFA